MTYRIVLRHEARVDFDDAFDWYDRRRPGLGAEFASNIQNALVRIANAPEQFELVLNEVRRASVRRFPYSIYFKLEGDRAIILAIFHSKRDPRSWQSRN